ncbi:Na+/H+ antiporter NhaA [bacterium]|nr:MAG: Na+/H+ antiporter NhaA [bacterium]
MAAPKRFVPTVAPTPLRDRLVRPIVHFAENEASSGMLLVALAAVAMLWANLGPAGHYETFWNRPLTLSLGDAGASLSLRHWINDGLMALFFLLMGLEIKREFLLGELSDARKAALPVAAALGGMIVPAALYALVNIRGGNMRGTGVPMATDIAFSLGVLALLRSRAPAGLKVLLAAVAIVDDLGAVLVIAIFYSTGIAWTMVAGMAVCLVILIVLNRIGARLPLAYMAVGIPLWAFTLASGVHATIAGVLLAMTVPVRVFLDPVAFTTEARDAIDTFEATACEDPYEMNPERQEAVSALESACERVQMPLERMENTLLPWVSYGIVPLFALANAGVVLTGFAPLLTPVGIGVLVGLVLGKPLGVVLASRLAVRSGRAELPNGVGSKHLIGIGLLAGIGFTMSLFISELAFGEGASHDAAKTATLAASVVMGLAGYVYLHRVSSKTL